MENKTKGQALKFGLIGKNIDYSFSRGYFAEKFSAEHLPHQYVNFDIDTIEQFPNIIKNNSNLKGLNVTIPYKQCIIPFLDDIHPTAQFIGAINTIKITPKGKCIGYNTDYYGFKKSLEPLLQSRHKAALILGTGGASKAVAYALQQLQISYKYVSRSSKTNQYTYQQLNTAIILEHQIIINCTPLGTFPNVTHYPNLPYNAITKSHILFDLIYNPPETTFLKLGKQNGATICNGLKMLQLQAEKAWEIWQ